MSKKSIKKLCEHCNSEYLTYKKSSRYCCRGCYDKSRYLVIDKKCKSCGNIFQVRPGVRSEKVYCSMKCSNSRLRTLHIHKECPTCKIEFHTTSSESDRIYCSKKCYTNSSNSNIEKICSYCDIKFIVSYEQRDRKYCSIECSNKSKITSYFKKCKMCSNNIKMKPSIEGRAFYCSRECMLSDDEYIQKITPNKEVKLKMRKSAIKRIEYTKFNDNQVIPSYNPSSIPILESKAKELNIDDLQHAENGGEYYIKELGYWVDGYSKSKNIVLEYDEKHHFKNGKLKKKDIKRQKEIEDYLKCKFIRIKYED